MEITRIETQKTQQTTTEMAEYTQIILEIQWTTEVSRSYNQLLRQMYKILTNLLPMSCPSLWTNYTQNYYCQYNKKYLNSRLKTRQFIKNNTQSQWNTEVSRSYTQLLRQIYKILTDLLPSTCPSLWTIHTQKLLLSIYPKYLNSTALKLLLNAITLNTTP